ncbi:MAG TPA: IS66 family insertion sequence element accessory protein TnpB [Candidatus Limnocylindrales bacterium]|nr:IS66 family insertion sequence element accessory protein TnpB [Candidatus Limnocylindrales bacterium]
MLTLPPSVRIYVALGATDIRKGIDGLCAAAREVIGEDPFTGHLFAFANRRRDAVKVLVWDRSGFWLLYKRLERGTFQWPAAHEKGPRIEMRSRDFFALLEGLDLSTARWRTRLDGLPAHAER